MENHIKEIIFNITKKILTREKNMRKEKLFTEI